MIYSGVDLIRHQTHINERADKVLNKPVEASVKSSAPDTEDGAGGGALLRFARFIRKRKSSSKHPYHRSDSSRDKGQLLDVYV
jgi:hypothetical protein